MKEAKVAPIDHGPIQEHKGFSWKLGTIFLIGDLAGGGMMALPHAISNAGIIPGGILLLISAITTGYTAYLLGENWCMMKQRWQKYRKPCRKPFSEMGRRACGPGMRNAITIMLCIAQFGFATVLVLLASKNAAVLLNYIFGLKVNFCYLIVLVGLAVWPATMLKSPMHFWQVAVFSAASSSFAVILLVWGMSNDAPTCTKEVPHSDFNPGKFLMSFGTMVFAFGGHAAFPTIQHDMKKPHHFKISVFITYPLIAAYYFVVAFMSYFVYGNTVNDAIIFSIQTEWIRQSVNGLIAVHVITTIVIALSPMTQQIEELFKMSHKFGWQRFLNRSMIFWSCIFAALSLPNFGVLLEFIGASIMPVMCLILPSYFYLLLKASQAKREQRIASCEISADSPDDEFSDWRDILYYTTKLTLAANLFVIAFGVIGGVIATSTAGYELVTGDLATPCYVQYLREGGLQFSDSHSGAVNCCGFNRDLTWLPGVKPEDFCSADPQ